jgi:hypothetical protein
MCESSQCSHERKERVERRHGGGEESSGFGWQQGEEHRLERMLWNGAWLAVIPDCMSGTDLLCDEWLRNHLKGQKYDTIFSYNSF